MRHKQFEERYNQIYKAAIALFRERGFDNTKISDICKAAGVPVGSIYHYFSCKEDFLDAYAKQLGTKGHHILEDSALDEDPVRVLSDYYLYKAAVLDDTGHVLCRDINERFSDIWMTNLEYNEYSGVSCLTPFLRSRIEAGQFVLADSAEDAAWLIQALFQGCVSYWLQVKGSVSLPEITQQRFLPIVIKNLTWKAPQTDREPH